MNEEWEKKEFEKMAKMREERKKKEEVMKLKWREIYGSDDRWDRFNELCKQKDERIAKRIAEKERKESENKK